jgi:predicted RNA-binding Zn-ribbon protein involved in translation (DUF1610 family)
MKMVHQEFLCPECGQIRWLKAKNICVDCKDKIMLDKISQSRKSQNVFNEQVCVKKMGII